MENQSVPLTRDFKKMFKHTKCLLINGRYALRSLRYFRRISRFCILINDWQSSLTYVHIPIHCSYKEHHAVDVNVVCDEIKNLKNVLQR